MPRLPAPRGTELPPGPTDPTPGAEVLRQPPSPMAPKAPPTTRLTKPLLLRLQLQLLSPTGERKVLACRRVLPAARLEQHTFLSVVAAEVGRGQQPRCRLGPVTLRPAPSPSGGSRAENTQPLALPQEDRAADRACFPRRRVEGPKRM